MVNNISFLMTIYSLMNGLGWRPVRYRHTHHRPCFAKIDYYCLNAKFFATNDDCANETIVYLCMSLLDMLGYHNNNINNR